jgi:DNA-binding winged helix-turn-helix (wHTH) protein
MASKALSVIDTTTESQPSPMAAIDFRCNEDEMPLSRALVLASVPPAGGDPQLRHLQADLLGSANYQVALIPPAKQTTHIGGLGSPLPMLLLPLTWKELVARVRAEADESRLLQRSIVHFGGVSVDLFRVEVTRSGATVSLTALEFKVLKFFVTNPERVISRDELLDRVWGYENYPVTRTVDNQLMRLRQKLEADPRNPVHFQTVHGVGYKFVCESRPTPEKRI